MNARIPEDALPPTLDPKALQDFVDDKWDNEIIPALTDYIAIPAKSPAFDADWEKNAFIERVVRDAAQWVEAQKVSGLKLEVVRLPGRTPVIFFDAPATRSDNGVNINNINPALNTDHVAAEMSILRYAVNAYVIGTTTAGEQGLYRIQLGDDNNWQSPQLLLPGITAMNISYGYVGNCAPSGAAASDISRETFTFANALDATQNPPTPALIRITLNGNTLAAQGKDMESAASRTDAGNVYVYNIEATLRGGNTCADRSI